MKNHQSRRTFVGALALGATATGMATVAHPLRSWYLNRPVALDESPENRNAMDWFDKIKGNHRAVFDGSMPHGGFPIIWNWAYYLSHNETGSPDSDITGLTVLRHDAIPFALDSSLWAKYQLGEHFNITDNATGQASLRNPYYQPKEGDMPMPGIGGIKSLLDRGAMFCVCNLALKVYSEMAAHRLGMDPKTAYKEWVDAVLEGIQVVPSGVWALGRAQDHRCAYIYAGG